MKFRLIPPNRAVQGWTVEGWYSDGKWKHLDTFKSKRKAIECIKLLEQPAYESEHYIAAQEKAEYL